MKNLYILIILLFGFMPAYAQIQNEELKDVLNQQGIPESTIEEELKNRGMTEEEAIKKAKEEGLTPEELLYPKDVIKENEEGKELEEDPDAEEEDESDEDKEEGEEGEEEDEDGEEGEEGEEDEEDKEERIWPEEAIYGQGIFRNKSLKLFEPSGNFKAPANYLIGVGDEFSITIWGRAQHSNVLKVNNEGYIKDQYVPRVYVKGMTHEKALAAIRSNMESAYNMKDSFMEIILSYSRQLTIGIYGNVFDPGSYSVSSLNTALNSLIAAGGPNQTGSVRRIKVMKPGGMDRLLDVYKYLEKSGNVESIYLENNDVIFVPAAEKVVQIQGAIKRPMIYELLEGESVLDLIKYAGGLNANAYKNNVQILRYKDDRQVLVDINLNTFSGSNKEYALKDGDVITVPEVTETFRNYVLTEGAVEQEGVFELKSSMRISDLIQKTGLSIDARTDVVYLMRKQDDLTNRFIKINLDNVLANRNSIENIELQPQDKLKVFSKSDFIDEFSVSVVGHVRKPGQTEYDENLRISDLIYFSGGVKSSASEIALLKSPEFDKSISYKRVNLTEVLANPESEENVLLKPKDELIVYPKSRFLDEFNVSVYGAVREPGTYPYSPNMTLNDVLFVSGGLKEEAANSRVEVSRILKDNIEEATVVVATLQVDKELVLSDKKGFKLEPYDQVFIRNAPGFELQRNITIEGEVQYPGVYPLVDRNEKILSIIERAGGLSPSAFKAGATLKREEDEVGYILLDLEEVMDNPTSKFNYVLKEKDVIFVPKVKDLVSIAGAINFPGIDTIKRLNVPYHKNKNALFYVNKYGAGVDRKGKKGRKKLVYVTQPNGHTMATRTILGIKRYPQVEEGADIKVYAKKRKPERINKEREETDWGKVFATTLTQVSAVLTLIILFDRAFTNE